MGQVLEGPTVTHDTQEPHETQEAYLTQKSKEKPVSVNNKEGKPPQSSYKKRSADEKLDAAFQILTKASKTSHQDPNECEIFGNLVGKKLQKYSIKAQTAVQEAMMNILFAADRGYYDQQYPQSHSTLQNSQFVDRPSINQDSQLTQSKYSVPPATHWDSGSSNYSTIAVSPQTPQSLPIIPPLSSPADSYSSDGTNYPACTLNPTIMPQLTDLNMPAVDNI